MLIFFVTTVSITDPETTDKEVIAKQNGVLQKQYQQILFQYMLFSKMLKGMSTGDFYGLNIQERDFMLTQFNAEIAEQKEAISKSKNKR